MVQKMVITWYYMSENILVLLLWVLSKKHDVSMVNVQKDSKNSISINMVHVPKMLLA